MPVTEINGVALHYHVQGTGTPIVFVHPPFLTSDNFNYQKAQLSDQFQVITFDIRGHGRSAVSVQPLTYPLIVEDIKQLMDSLGADKAYICGYSTGGSIALEAALTYPDRFLGCIPVGGMSEVGNWILRQRIRLASVMSLTKPTARFLSWGVALGNSDSNQTFKNLYQSALQGNHKNVQQYYKYSLTYNCTKRLNRIKAPVLLICGAKDKQFLRHAKMMLDLLPDATLEIIPAVRHQIPTKAALQMNDSIRKWILLRHDEEAEQAGREGDVPYAAMHEDAGGTADQALHGM